MYLFRRVFFGALAIFFLGSGAGWSVLLAEDVVSAPGVSTSSIAPTPAADPNQTPPESENGYLKLSFDRLAAFVFVAPAFDGMEPKSPALGNEQIPAVVKNWDGKKAVITGYMAPVKMEKGLATEFLVMRNTLACCYGGIPNLNEWVIVKMKKGGVRVLLDVPVAFYGDFKVGARLENGSIIGIYQLDCERMVDVKS